MSEERNFSVSLRRREGFRFEVDFGLEGVDPLIMDEPEPVGADSGPNAGKVLAAALHSARPAPSLSTFPAVSEALEIAMQEVLMNDRGPAEALAAQDRKLRERKSKGG